MKDKKTKSFYDFGAFRLDAKNRRLTRDGKTISLTPKEFDLLFLLVERAGETVSKDDLLEAIWADTFVEEGTLTRNVSWLRKKLSEAGKSETPFIETVPKRGYRFLPPVVAVETDEEISVEEHTVQRIHISEKIEIVPGANDDSEAFERIIQKAQTPAPVASPVKTLSAAPPAKRRFSYLWIVPALLVLAVGAFFVYRIYFENPAPEAIQITKIAPFSGLPGRENQPAFSPDDKLLAFTWNGGEQGDNADVYVKMIGAGEPIRLTENRADDVSPAFSPDGKQIAFLRVLPTRSEVFIVPALGGAERKICDLSRNRSTIAFSPDNRLLAVYDEDADKQSGIFTVNIETGEKKRLTAPPELSLDDQPLFSPKGDSIAFLRSRLNAREIFIVPAAGGEARQLTFDQERIGGIAWSADGEQIFFSSRRKYNGRSNLWQIDAARGGQPKVIATGSERPGAIAVSHDAKLIAFVEESYDTNIWRVEIDKLPERDAFQKFAASRRNDDSPNVSPDGSQVVFASTRAGKYDVWVSDANGANVRQLTDLKDASAGSPRFSPDGKWIAFDAQSAGNSDVYIVSANGGAVRRVTDSAAMDYMPAWSADGNSIFFASNRSGAAQIYRVSAAGGEARQITTNGGSESFASPDGKFLYYRKNEIRGEIWRVPADGGEEQSVPTLADAAFWRYWTMTATGVYFVRHTENPPYKIMFYNFANGQLKEIAAVDIAPVSVYPGLGVSGDGKTILYTQNDQNASSIIFAEIKNE